MRNLNSTVRSPQGAVKRSGAVPRVLLATLACGWLGCGGEQTPQAEQPLGRGEGVDSQHTKPEDARETVEAVREALSAIAEGHPDRLWKALPASYQQDLQSAVHRFAERIPPETWTATAERVRRTLRLLGDRKEWFLSHPFLARVPTLDDPDEAALDPMRVLHANWDEVLAVLERLADSDLADPEKVRTLDVEAFLAETGRSTATRLFDLAGDEATAAFRRDLAGITVESVSREGDVAVVRIGGAAYEEVEHEFRRVEGKWLPASLVSEWPDRVGRLTEGIDDWRFDADSWAATLDRWSLALDGLERAADEAEFHARLDEWLIPSSPSIADGPGTPGGTADGGVTVVFKGRLDLESVDAVQSVLNAAAADPDLAVSVDAIVGETTEFSVSHAGAIDEFAERLGNDEAVTILAVDPERQRIEARWSSRSPDKE